MWYKRSHFLCPEVLLGQIVLFPFRAVGREIPSQICILTKHRQTPSSASPDNRCCTVRSSSAVVNTRLTCKRVRADLRPWTWEENRWERAVMSLGGLNRPHSRSICWMWPMTSGGSAVYPTHTQLQTTQHTDNTHRSFRVYWGRNSTY